MIRLVTRTRLARLAAGADAARARTCEVQGQADAAYSSHIREVFALTARAEAAEKDAATADLGARLLQSVLEDTSTELTQAREELAAMARRLEELSEPPVDASVVLLLYYGEPHSIHPDKPTAYAYAATLGAPLNGWRLADERPAAAVTWRCVPFIYDAARDHFRSVAAPAVAPSGGAA
ncbi:hypothetical protein [Streptomyces lydicus]|uniref:Uncharacterized protein n=1 Tax=Streptomyces lydicus TaxID=47763 RepID=A0A1D7VV47_9ACTN|nr:hypothetical protein [Streptomyces lydicus]AOP50627.1 hypothetical protein SL103_34150 [Streptomyces lydicus]